MANQISKCKGCGADIIWVKTKNGKSMPCDAKKQIIVTETGEVVSGYTSHFATCPKSKDFKEAKND